MTSARDPMSDGMKSRKPGSRVQGRVALIQKYTGCAVRMLCQPLNVPGGVLEYFFLHDGNAEVLPNESIRYVPRRIDNGS